MFTAQPQIKSERADSFAVILRSTIYDPHSMWGLQKPVRISTSGFNRDIVSCLTKIARFRNISAQM
jgi:hypothetical protein